MEKTETAKITESQKSVVAPNLSGKHILIAEDNEINQVLIESMLDATQAELTTVGNGKLAVEAFQKESFDLVLMDIQMPEMDGIEALHAIRELTTKVPIIALTANVMVSDVENYLQQGFVAHVGKPIDMNSLYGVLTRFMK